MTASAEPAVWIRLPISGVEAPLSLESSDDFCECEPTEMEEIAESIEDVRGGPRAISIRFELVAGIGGLVIVGAGSSFPRDLIRGSDTLLEEPFGLLTDEAVLWIVSTCVSKTLQDMMGANLEPMLLAMVSSEFSL
jgi:hypothetical protein